MIPLASGEHLPAVLFSPEGPTCGGALVVHDIYGASSFYESFAGRVAQEGFAALLPNFFFRLPELSERTREAALGRRARLDERAALEELGRAIDWLKARREVEEGEIVGTVGFCMGGNFVLNLAAQRSDLVTVSYYAFPRGVPGPLDAPLPLDVVDEIHGPVLAFWGEDDESVGMESVYAFGKAMAARGKDYTQVIYPEVGHSFMVDAGEDAESAGYYAATDSWKRMLDFYRRHLVSAPIA